MAILYIFGNKRGGGGDSEIVSIFHRVCSKNGTEDLLVSRYEIVSSFFLDYKDKVWKILRFVISIHVCTGYKAIMLLSVDMKICESNLILNFVNHSHLVFNLIYIEFNQWTRWKSWTGSLTLKDQIWETAAQIQLLLGLLHDNDNERLPPTGPLGTTPSRRRDGKFRFFHPPPKKKKSTPIYNRTFYQGVYINNNKNNKGLLRLFLPQGN